MNGLDRGRRIRDQGPGTGDQGRRPADRRPPTADRWPSSPGSRPPSPTTGLRILLAILESGGGHRSAARAVAAALHEAAPGVEVVIEDVGAGMPVPVLNDPPAAYRLFLDSPVRPAFEVAWRLFDRRATARTCVQIVYPIVRRHAAEIVERLRPDLIVAMHAGVAQVFGRLRREARYAYRLATVVTDIVSVHALWSSPADDLTLVPTEEAHCRLLRLGVDPGRTLLAGFPIHPEFGRLANGARPSATPPERPRVLLMGGGAGAGGIAAMLAGLERSRRSLAVDVVTGRNPALYERLRGRCYRHEVHVHGFVEGMPRLMSGCDVVVTKAGPGSLMEAWALRKPALVGAAVGPQEVGNLEWGARRGLAWPAGGPDTVHERLEALLDRWPEAVAGMQPIPVDGAHRIAEHLLGLVGAPARPCGRPSATAPAAAATRSR